MFEVRRISPKNLARIVMTIAVMLHMAIGLVIAGAVQLAQSFITEWAGVSIAAWSILTIWFAGAVAVGIVSYILGLFAAFLYNMTAQWWGGLRVTLIPVGLQKAQKQAISQQEAKPAVRLAESDSEPPLVIPKTLADSSDSETVSAPALEKRPVRRSPKKTASVPAIEEEA